MWEALFDEIRSGTGETLEKFISLPAGDKQDLTFKNSEGRTILHIAVSFNRLALIPKILRHQIKIDALDRDDRTALHYALANKNSEILSILIKYGADLEIPIRGKLTPLLYAAQQRDFYSLKALIKAGANKDAVDDHGRTAGFLASKSLFDLSNYKTDLRLTAELFFCKVPFHLELSPDL